MGILVPSEFKAQAIDPLPGSLPPALQLVHFSGPMNGWPKVRVGKAMLDPVPMGCLPLTQLERELGSSSSGAGGNTQE